MTISLTNVQQTEFDVLVKKAYQSKGSLIDDAVYKRMNVVGRFEQFRKMGYVVAVPQPYLDTMTPQDANFNFETATINKYAAPTAVDDVQELTVNFSVKSELAEVVGYAIRRRTDQIAIDAISSSGTSNVVAVDFGTPSTNSNLPYTKVVEVETIFDDAAVDRENKHFMFSAFQSRSLLQQIQFTNNLYSNVGQVAVNRGTMDMSNSVGLQMHVIPSMVEGGLPYSSGTIREVFAWDKRTIGFAMGKNFTTYIDRIPQNDSWLVAGIFSAGAVTIDNVGVVEVLCDEAVV